LDFTLEKGLRPTSHRLRQTVFNSLIHRFFHDRIGNDLPLEGMKVLDLFSGLGAYGLESLSLGASHVIFVEKHFSTTRLIEGYARQLGCVSQVRILCKTWPYPNPALDTFDLVFMDPPYDADIEFVKTSVQACAPFMGESSLLMLEFPHPMTAIESLFPIFSKKAGEAYFTFFQKHPQNSYKLG